MKPGASLQTPLSITDKLTDGASNKKQTILILNLEEYQNYWIGSKFTSILLNGLILPTGGVASGRVYGLQPAQQAWL